MLRLGFYFANALAACFPYSHGQGDYGILLLLFITIIIFCKIHY